MEALWDHVTDDPEELPFEAEERLVVVDATDANWWYATYLEQVSSLIIPPKNWGDCSRLKEGSSHGSRYCPKNIYALTFARRIATLHRIRLRLALARLNTASRGNRLLTAGSPPTMLSSAPCQVYLASSTGASIRTE